MDEKKRDDYLSRVPHTSVRALLLGLLGKYDPEAPAPVHPEEKAQRERKGQRPLTQRDCWDGPNLVGEPLGLNPKGHSENLPMLAHAAAWVCERRDESLEWMVNNCAGHLKNGWMGSEGGTGQYAAYGMAAVRAVVSRLRRLDAWYDEGAMVDWLENGLLLFWRCRFNEGVLPIGARIQEHYPNECEAIYLRSLGLGVHRRHREQPTRWPYLVYELADQNRLQMPAHKSIPPMRSPIHREEFTGGVSLWVEESTNGNGSPVMAVRANGNKVQGIGLHGPWPKRANVQAKTTIEGDDAVVRGQWRPPIKGDWRPVEARLRIRL